MGNLHYESILGYLEAQSKRNGDYLQEYSGLYSWMVELVYRLLYFRQVNNEDLIDSQLQRYEGFCSLIKGDSPLWVFSLNHDLIIESIAEKFSIPIYTGFGSGRVTLPRRNEKGEKIGFIEAEVLTENELENGAMYFPNPPCRGIYLLKIHGALDVFTFNEGKDLLKFARAEYRGRRYAHYQRSRKSDKAVRTWTLELVVRRVTTQRQAGSCDHELDPVGTHEWA